MNQPQICIQNNEIKFSNAVPYDNGSVQFFDIEVETSLGRFKISDEIPQDYICHGLGLKKLITAGKIAEIWNVSVVVLNSRGGIEAPESINVGAGRNLKFVWGPVTCQ